MTAKDGADERERCLDAGASDYLPKPINTPELLMALAGWMAPAETPPTA